MVKGTGFSREIKYLHIAVVDFLVINQAVNGKINRLEYAFLDIYNAGGSLYGMLQEVRRRKKSVSVSLEEKETSALALAHTLALFQYPERTKAATQIHLILILALAHSNVS